MDREKAAAPIKPKKKEDNLPLYLFCSGKNRRAYEYMGLHKAVKDGKPCMVARVWAPNAKAVSLVGDFCNWDPAKYPMQEQGGGVWEGYTDVAFAPYELYKFYIKTADGEDTYKADPYANHCETRPGTASRWYDLEGFTWHDKTWYAQKEGIDPSKIVSVSVMPCTAKKFEIKRDDENAAGLPDVDISLTTRELAKMIKKAQLNFNRLPDEKFDAAMGESTGAAVIFGATGGVMEAALRTAADVLTGEPQDAIDYQEVRGTEGIKEAVYKVAGMDVKVAVASGLSNANKILEKIRAGEADYHFVEIMCCPGGCVNGGGQPIVSATERSFTDVKAQRAKALYDQDKAMPLRKSHENPVLKKCYEEFLGEPGSHKAHEVLHTSYVKRGY